MANDGHKNGKGEWKEDIEICDRNFVRCEFVRAVQVNGKRWG
jgi:hypothetical protein